MNDEELIKETMMLDYSQLVMNNVYCHKEIRNFIETQGNTIILNHHIYEKQQLEIERLNNIIKRLEEFIEKEIELYTLELTEKNTNALSYSLPIRGVYKEIYNVLQELKGSDKE